MYVFCNTKYTGLLQKETSQHLSYALETSNISKDRNLAILTRDDWKFDTKIRRRTGIENCALKKLSKVLRDKTFVGWKGGWIAMQHLILYIVTNDGHFVRRWNRNVILLQNVIDTIYENKTTQITATYEERDLENLTLIRRNIKKNNWSGSKKQVIKLRKVREWIVELSDVVKVWKTT